MLIRTNVDIEYKVPFLKEASATLADALAKPESYVMVQLAAGESMLFGGSDAPTAFVELKSLGLDVSQTTALSQTICGLLQSHFAIEPGRTYIEFAAPERAMFGWNNGTF
jgi:hypothetical protein